MKRDYDVAIIGSGIAGAMLAAILAKHGASVILLDAGTHPRFAVGESMVPESAILLEILAERYGIPELAYPGNIAAINRHIGSSAAGIKLAFSFAWNGHRREHDIADVVSTPVLTPEAHLFRQDVDAYYVGVAARLGAVVKQQTRIRAIDVAESGVTLDIVDEPPLRARFVVDAAGYRAPLADQLELRKGAREMQATTRSLFTHMIGVDLYEKAIAPVETHGAPIALAQTTLHHLFDCGWLWIIPFDNQPFSTNPLCSVGLQFDIGKHGPATRDPEGEFRQFLADYPSVAKHFVNAARVREWTVAPRLNYTSRETVGDRYCLLGHAVGFVDPLFSRGLVNTFESIVRLAPRLIAAVRDDVWKRANLASLERYSLEVVRVNDRLVANSYTAFKSFPLWNAWFRIWLSGSYIGVLRLRKILADYQRGRDDDALEAAFADATYPGHLSIESHRYEQMFDAACATLERFKRAETTERDAIDTLHRLYVENRAHLPLDFSNFANRYVSRPTAEFAASLVDWANHAPDGLASKLARGPNARPFDFLDRYRYGDRLALAARADADLARATAPELVEK
ncbi:NAD(P)/FAD-dependent oxidoreductase [Burkholderia oklahomensis]|uniref:FAD binding domain protein n=1 Tax=Burkholderia oklahomensis TaxID=342113 RepID=A0AAI8B8C4_9BURK|nr:tryptophan 7-halogenase [Burkholderia oklahomensis]AIO67612.1 FAD binding domain protein [Burkholderia oklahomensis]AOI41642.1 alkylhalidase [Burkholderia oklahomensis EO147]KUY69240.1 alkylhalidase [Burkholderia oklahomensis EO147]QPS36380.1 tryptophan 7-halogenase [Burkholderia oklahomensis]